VCIVQHFRPTHRKPPLFVGAPPAHHRTNTISALSASEHKSQTREKSSSPYYFGRMNVPVSERDMRSIFPAFATGGRSCVSSEM
jgi:hypothetical protein